MASIDPQQLHLILIPLLCQSSNTPLIDFGILLAQRGVNISILTTHDNYLRYKPSIDLVNSSSNINIKILSLNLPCEQTDEVMIRGSLEKIMQELVPPPSCMVSGGPGYTHEIACKFKIPYYAFNARSCFSTTCALKIARNKLYENTNPYTDSFLVPDIPHKVELKGYQSPFFRRINVAQNQIAGTQNATEEKPYPIGGMLVNSFEEMEAWYFRLFKDHIKVYGIGPVSLCHKEILDKANRGQKASVDANRCLSWLDSMKPGSVIYACFGSLSCIPTSQSVEIGLGLESSNQPFIWVIRETIYSADIGRWLETTKIEQRVEGRGLVIRGWAPQLLILSHPSIGGFLTHCGWNSTLEGVCAGVPMITWPMFEEQFVNEKFVTDVLEIGVSISGEARLSSKEVIIKSERVKAAIEDLMNGEKAGDIKRRARELGVLANKAAKEGGSSHSDITKFIQDVISHV